MAKATKTIDSNLYGERPDYSKGMPEDRVAELSRALNWLNYHTDSNELLKFSYQYMEKKLSKANYTAFKKAPQILLNFTTQLFKQRPDGVILFFSSGLSFYEKMVMGWLARFFGVTVFLFPRAGALMRDSCSICR